MYIYMYIYVCIYIYVYIWYTKCFSSPIHLWHTTTWRLRSPGLGGPRSCHRGERTGQGVQNLADVGKSQGQGIQSPASSNSYLYDLYVIYIYVNIHIYIYTCVIISIFKEIFKDQFWSFRIHCRHLVPCSLEPLGTLRGQLHRGHQRLCRANELRLPHGRQVPKGPPRCPQGAPKVMLGYESGEFVCV